MVALSSFSEFSEQPLKAIQKSGYDISLNKLKRRLLENEIVEFAQGCHGIIAGVEPYTASVLSQLTDLKCISRCGAGIDNIDLGIAKKRGIVIKNTPEVVIQPVVELTIAMIFDLIRKLSFFTQKIQSRQWVKAAGFLLAGKKVGIIGLGRIGKKVAEVLKLLDADVYGSDLVPDMHWAEKYRVSIVPTKELLARCDIVTIHVSPAHNDNGFLLGQKELRSMKKGAFLINTARGNLVNENALYELLKNEHLGGAAQDVYSEEPYSGPLCNLENVVLTPHVATLTKESRIQMELEAVNKLLDTLVAL